MHSRRKFFWTAAAGAPCALTAQEHVPAHAPDPFRTAVIAGDLETACKLLDRDPALLYARDAAGVSVYTLACLNGRTTIADEFKRRGLVTDIFEAAAAGDAARAKELMKENFGLVWLRSPDGRTPLHFAIAAGKKDMVPLLLSSGARLSAGDESPLLAAIEYPDAAIAYAMASSLLVNASDPNAKRKDGSTALQLAVKRGHADLVRLLIHRGAEASLQDTVGIDIVYYAARYTKDLKGNPVVRDDTNGLPQELINHFVTVGHFDLVQIKQLYAKSPALLHTRATWDELAVEAGAHTGQVPIVQYLADQGATISTCTATLLGLTDRVKQTIQADAACVRERGAHDIPLLAYTGFASEHAELAAWLIGQGADVSARFFGQTVLHLAAAKGHLELARVLLEAGADVNALGNANATPLAVAVRSKQPRMEQFLKDRGGRA